MSRTQSPRATRWIVATGLIAGATWLLLPSVRNASTWQSLASPGPLSRAHASLEDNCAACHEPVVGPTPARCILCHASDTALLQRQPTAFHANVSGCKECHTEHRGRSPAPAPMNHAVLATIGLRELQSRGAPEDLTLARYIPAWPAARGGSRPTASSLENTLNCTACHATADPHAGLFGTSCTECHTTDTWTIPAFRHPQARSRACGSCHQAPPSHYMMHFKMISARIARKPQAKVNQCYECHRTTAWTDILGIGRYKHH